MSSNREHQEKVLKEITKDGSKPKVTSIDFDSDEVREKLKSVREAQAAASKRKQLSWRELSSVRVRF